MDIEFFQNLELEYKLLVNLVTVMRFELINCMGKNGFPLLVYGYVA